MSRFYNFSQLGEPLLAQYRDAVQDAFPEIVHQSEVARDGWVKVEEYYPQYQRFLVNESDQLIGLVNTLPFYWDQPLTELPDEGWDWLVHRGIHGHEAGIQPNYLGGLQIVVTKAFLGQGFSKVLIQEGKKIKEKFGYRRFILPIRPTFKSKHPEMKMRQYLKLRKDDKVYDPWIRTHLSCGAKIIGVCANSMHISGKISFWEELMHQKIASSGNYVVAGALNPVLVQVENNYGEYCEENIWIYYN